MNAVLVFRSVLGWLRDRWGMVSSSGYRIGCSRGSSTVACAPDGVRLFLLARHPDSTNIRVAVAAQEQLPPLAIVTPGALRSVADCFMRLRLKSWQLLIRTTSLFLVIKFCSLRLRNTLSVIATLQTCVRPIHWWNSATNHWRVQSGKHSRNSACITTNRRKTVPDRRPMTKTGKQSSTNSKRLGCTTPTESCYGHTEWTGSEVIKAVKAAVKTAIVAITLTTGAEATQLGSIAIIAVALATGTEATEIEAAAELSTTSDPIDVVTSVVARSKRMVALQENVRSAYRDRTTHNIRAANRGREPTEAVLQPRSAYRDREALNMCTPSCATSPPRCLVCDCIMDRVMSCPYCLLAPMCWHCLWTHITQDQCNPDRLFQAHHAGLGVWSNGDVRVLADVGLQALRIEVRAKHLPSLEWPVNYTNRLIYMPLTGIERLTQSTTHTDEPENPPTPRPNPHSGYVEQYESLDPVYYSDLERKGKIDGRTINALWPAGRHLGVTDLLWSSAQCANALQQNATSEPRSSKNDQQNDPEQHKSRTQARVSTGSVPRPSSNYRYSTDCDEELQKLTSPGEEYCCLLLAIGAGIMSLRLTMSFMSLSVPRPVDYLTGWITRFWSLGNTAMEPPKGRCGERCGNFWPPPPWTYCTRSCMRKQGHAAYDDRDPGHICARCSRESYPPSAQICSPCTPTPPSARSVFSIVYAVMGRYRIIGAGDTNIQRDSYPKPMNMTCQRCYRTVSPYWAVACEGCGWYPLHIVCSRHHALECDWGGNEGDHVQDVITKYNEYRDSAMQRGRQEDPSAPGGTSYKHAGTSATIFCTNSEPRSSNDARFLGCPNCSARRRGNDGCLGCFNCSTRIKGHEPTYMANDRVFCSTRCRSEKVEVTNLLGEVISVGGVSVISRSKPPTATDMERLRQYPACNGPQGQVTQLGNEIPLALQNTATFEERLRRPDGTIIIPLHSDTMGPDRTVFVQGGDRRTGKLPIGAPRPLPIGAPPGYKRSATPGPDGSHDSGLNSGGNTSTGIETGNDQLVNPCSCECLTWLGGPADIDPTLLLYRDMWPDDNPRHSEEPIVQCACMQCVTEEGETGRCQCRMPQDFLTPNGGLCLPCGQHNWKLWRPGIKVERDRPFHPSGPTAKKKRSEDPHKQQRKHTDERQTYNTNTQQEFKSLLFIHEGSMARAHNSNTSSVPRPSNSELGVFPGKTNTISVPRSGQGNTRCEVDFTKVPTPTPRPQSPICNLCDGNSRHLVSCKRCGFSMCGRCRNFRGNFPCWCTIGPVTSPSLLLTLLRNEAVLLTLSISKKPVVSDENRHLVWEYKQRSALKVIAHDQRTAIEKRQSNLVLASKRRSALSSGSWPATSMWIAGTTLAYQAYQGCSTQHPTAESHAERNSTSSQKGDLPIIVPNPGNKPFLGSQEVRIAVTLHAFGVPQIQVTTVDLLAMIGLVMLMLWSCFQCCCRNTRKQEKFRNVRIKAGQSFVDSEKNMMGIYIPRSRGIAPTAHMNPNCCDMVNPCFTIAPLNAGRVMRFCPKCASSMAPMVRSGLETSEYFHAPGEVDWVRYARRFPAKWGFFFRWECFRRLYGMQARPERPTFVPNDSSQSVHRDREYNASQVHHQENADGTDELGTAVHCERGRHRSTSMVSELISEYRRRSTTGATTHDQRTAIESTSHHTSMEHQQMNEMID